MTTHIEDRLRTVLRDMADEVRPSPPPVELDWSAAAPVRWRVAVAAAAIVMAVSVAVGAVTLLREPDKEFIEPVVRPPKVVKLSDTDTRAPGRSLLGVLPAIDPADGGGRTLHLLPVGDAPVSALRTTAWVRHAFSQHLSWDGTRVVRQFDVLGSPRLEIVNLETGAINRLGGRRGYCPALSPDNATVAVFDLDFRLTLLDARDGKIVRQGRPADGTCVRMGWSPDGKLLAVPGSREQLVVDSRGRTVAQLGADRPVNGHMSWSPDARSLLLYDESDSGYLVKDVIDDVETRLTAPPDAVRPLGWAGSEVVWLVGEPGDYRLVTTDRTGADPQRWMAIDAGDRSIETVQWSWDLSGRPVPDDLAGASVRP